MSVCEGCKGEVGGNKRADEKVDGGDDDDAKGRPEGGAVGAGDAEVVEDDALGLAATRRARPAASCLASRTTGTGSSQNGKKGKGETNSQSVSVRTGETKDDDEEM